MKHVQGKTALITGAASGMGLLWARHFVEDGANVVLWDINRTGLDEAASALKRAGLTIWTRVVNVADAATVAQAGRETIAETGGVDILINNAGIVFADDFLHTPPEVLSKTVDVDLKALMWTMQAFLPAMIERQSGHVVNVSSAAGFIGVPRMPAYVAAKWGVIGLTESVRLELKAMGARGVKFTLFCPSFVDTGMFEGAKPPRFTRLLRPEEVVTAAYKGFRKDEYVIHEPWLVKVTPALKGILPFQVFDLVSELLGVTGSMGEWRQTR